MRKILIIKDGLSIGGTTSSFLSFINAVSNYDDYEFDVWVHKREQAKDIELPISINEIESNALTKCFSIPSGILNKILYIIKTGQILLYIKAKLYRTQNRPVADKIPIYQKMDINRSRCVKTVDLTKYDLVITWEELFPMYFLANAVKAPKKLAFIHPNYKQAGFESNLDMESFSKLNAIVSVSENGCKDLLEAFPEYNSKFFHVRNCLNASDIKKMANDGHADEMNVDAFKFLTVCRLQNASKALDRAVKIAYQLKKDGFDFKWFIVGDGEDRETLSNMIVEYDLTDYVVLLGERKNPYPYMKKADMFVLQSYYEGLPVVVDESMIIGTPVLVSNYSAASEQVSEMYGIIADNDERSIYETIKEAICDKDKIRIMRDNLLDLDLQQYTDGEKYIELFEKVMK